jgi:hypothetical protein
MKPTIALALFLASASLPVAAQAPRVPPPPGETKTVVGRNPSVSYLMQRYSLAEAEAAERIAVQSEVVALSERMNAEGDPAYADMWIEHEPVFRVVLAFADNKDRKAFLDSVSPRLRRFVHLVNVAKSKRQVDSDLAAITAAIRASGIPFSGGFDIKGRRYVIEVESQNAAQQVRALIPPALRSEVDINVTRLPRNEAPPTGVQSGDWIAGGYDFYSSPSGNSLDCTWGFPVTFGASATKGILTARHCLDPAYAYLGSTTGHWVTFAAPIIAKQEGKYDYQIFETTGINQGGGYEVYFEDKNSIPEFPATGYFKVTGLITYMNQKYGMVMCKSGSTTGITCGEIIDGSAIHNGYNGWIKVSKTNQSDLSAGGDSGGPWFMYPGSATTVTAAGVHTAGGPGDNCVGTGSTCYAIYMPIDYIDDHMSSVRLVITP